MADTLNAVMLAVDQAVIGRYAELTDDHNPLHVDPEFAARSPFGGIIAHGTMSLNLIWQALSATLGPGALAGAVLEIRFTRPVRIGDTITAGGSASGPGSYDVWARNQDGVDVVAGVVRLAATHPHSA